MRVRAIKCDGTVRPESAKEAAVRENPAAVVQALRCGAGENLRFFELAAAQTMVALETGTLLARKPEVDLLLRIAGTSQISRAISNYGVRSGEAFILIVAVRGSRLNRIRSVKGTEVARKKLTGTEKGRLEAGALLSGERA